MEKKEIYDMVIQELIEKALSVRRETCSSDEKQFYETLKEKSERTRGVLKQLSEEEYQIVDDYMVHRKNVNISMCRGRRIVWSC